MASKNAGSGNAKSAGKGDFTFIVIYVLAWLTGIIFFIISGNDKRKKLHSMQAIVLGIIGTIISFIPFIGIIWILVWLYGLYIGYMGSTGKDVPIPGITDFVKQYV